MPAVRPRLPSIPAGHREDCCLSLPIEMPWGGTMLYSLQPFLHTGRVLSFALPHTGIRRLDSSHEHQSAEGDGLSAYTQTEKYKQ